MNRLPTLRTQPYAVSESGVRAVQPFLAKLKRNQDNVTMLVVGDSTGNATDEWVYLLTQWLGKQWPTHTVNYYLWDDAGRVYSSATVVQTGTGANTLSVYNCSVAGWNCMHPLLSFPTNIAAIQPDLTMVSLGHNEDTNMNLFNGYRAIVYSRYVALLESITAACPMTSVISVLQNPETDNIWQAQRASVYQQIAQNRGYGTIDVHQAFIDAGIPSSWYLDTKHPNSTGEQIWMNVVAGHFSYSPAASPLPRPPSSLLHPAENMLLNGRFNAFTGAVPDNWASTGATCAKDVSLFESPNGYSVKLTSTGASTAMISQTLSATQLKMVKNGWVTLAVRMRNNSVSLVNTHGEAQVIVGGGSSPVSSSTLLMTSSANFLWQVVSTFIPSTTTSVVVRLYADNGSSGTGNISIDRVILCRGNLPHDIPDPAGWG